MEVGHPAAKQFLAGGGEMGELTRTKDWSKTALGIPELWPQSLRTTLSILLKSKFPMFLFWGEELICFYNDAYRPSLGENGKHPSILGIRAKEAWAEIWDIIKPLIDQVLAGGEATWSEDQLIPIYRNGKMEDVYWTFSYSPVNDESGNTAGVLVTCSETTQNVITRKRLEESERKLRVIISEAPVSIGIFRGPNYVTEIANSRALELWGRKEEEVLNKPILEAMPELLPQGIKELLDEVYKTGKRFSAAELPVQIRRNGKLETAYINFSYEALYDPGGNIDGIMTVGLEVTRQVLSHKNIEANEEKLNIVIAASGLGTWELNVKTSEPSYSQRYLEIIGGYKDNIKLTHQELVQHLHPDDLPIRQNAFKEAFASGFLQYEARVIWKDNSIHWMQGRGKVFYDDENKPEKLIGTIRDITEEKNHQQEIEANDARLNLIIDASELGFWEFNPTTREMICSERCFKIFGYDDKQNYSHQQLLQHFHPDDLKIREEAFKKSFDTGILHYEVRIIRKDGMLRYVETKGKVVNDAGKLPVQLVGTMRDITEEKIIQQQLLEREQKFRLLADSMPQHIWTSDTEGNLNYFNQSVFDYSGLTLEQINKEGWIQIVHPDDREGNIKVWMDSITTGKDFLFEHRFRKHNGDYRWQLSRAIPQKDENGKIQMWVGTSTDIQEQKTFASELENEVRKRTAQLLQLNESLKKSEERYHLMVEEVQDYAIIYLNRKGIVENWNAGAEKIKGYADDEIVGKSFSTFYTEEDRKNKVPQKLLKQAVQSGKALQEGWRVRKDGNLFWASVVITALHNDTKEVIGFTKVTHDLSEKKKADDKLKMNAAELEKKNVDLQKMNKELQSFAYISSHDLQEPLRKIQTFASWIIEKEVQNLSESGKEHFNRMCNSANRMQSLIHDLLAYSRTQTSERKFENTSLAKIVEEVEADLHEELLEKKATIQLTGDCTVSISVIPFQFRQLFYNLISNSLKFTRSGHSPRIKIKGEIIQGKKVRKYELIKERNYYHICFSDSGIGFDQQFSERIFELFQRLHSREQFIGTGIGLAIVKKIAENHNGIIKASGKLGKGASFDIYIPAHQSNLNREK